MVNSELHNARNRWRRGGAALGVLLAGGGAVSAQAQVVQERVNELALTAELRHDTNVARSDRERANQRGLERADERLNLGVSLLLARPLGRHHVTLDAFAGYDFYRRNSRLNRERIAVSGDLQLNAGPCQANLLPQFSRQQSELYQLAVIDIPGIDSVRNTETTQLYRGELRCGNPVGLRPLVFYQRSYGDNSNPLRQVSDYRGEGYGGGVSYTHPTIGQFDLSLEREDTKYPNRPTPVGPVGYRLDQARLAVTRNIGVILTAHGYIAYSHLKPRNSAAPGFKGVSWLLGLTAVPLPNLRLNGEFSQSVRPSLGNDALYSRNREWLLEATYYLGPRTSVTLHGSRSERFFRGTQGLFGPALDKDRFDRLSARVDFNPSRRLTFGLEGGHEHRNANGTFYDYKNTYIALSTRFRLGAP